MIPKVNAGGKNSSAPFILCFVVAGSYEEYLYMRRMYFVESYSACSDTLAKHLAIYYS